MKKFWFLVLTICGTSVVGQKKLIEEDSLDIMIGQMIMIGIGDFNDAKSTQPIFDELERGTVGGVALFEKNLSKSDTRSELAKLILKIQKSASIPVFVAIDEEGGRVTRMKEKYGFSKKVSAQYLGDLDNLDSTNYYAMQTAMQLDSFGINMNYAPVVDVNLNTSNPVIGKIERSYSPDYSEVIEHAHEVVSVHNNNNVIPVLKHFPGHGSSKNDTHLGITDVTETWQFEELYPYKALIDSGVVKAIMTAHIVNQSLDRSKTPATLSGRVVTDMLRDFLNYQGVVVSDDMQMGAIKNEFGFRESIRMSLEAGLDILIFANNVEDFDMVTSTEIHRIIKELVADDVISRDRISESFKRIMKLKAEFGLLDDDYYKSLKNKLKAHN